MFIVDRFCENLINKYEECDFAFIPLHKLAIREKGFFATFMSSANTAIVIYYHVKNLHDWTWNCPDGNTSSKRCNIDDLANEVCNYIQEVLVKNSYFTKKVPYPNESGLQFRFVAIASGYGEIGKNAFYLHPKWGTKVHLRVLASEIASDPLCSIKLTTTQICLNCGECIRKCPANAYENGFEGLKCRYFRKKRGEYIPFGPRGVLRYCKTCVTVCKAGKDG